MKRPECRTCPYWDLDDPRNEESAPEWNPEQESIEEYLESIMDGGYLVGGECRRYPRTYPGRDTNDESSSWPRTDNGDWCGEHPDFPAYIASLRPLPTPADNS